LGKVNRYTLKDIRLEYDSSFSNGTLTSYYALFYKDGNKEYFDSDGKLIGKVDRFNNKIKFEYYTGDTKLWKITDTAGRVITFTYTQNTDTRTLTVSWSDPYNASIVLTSEKVSGYGDDYVLKSIENQELQTTTFDYSFDPASYNFFSKESSYVAAQNNVFANIKKITYPTAACTEYTYEKSTRNLGSGGIQEYYRAKSRKDNTNGKDYTLRTFAYSSDNYSGYPQYKDPSALSSDFTYTTTVTDTDNNTKVYTYDYKHLLKAEETRENGTTVTEAASYAYDNNKLPTRLAYRNYNKATGSYMEKIQNFQYNDFGDCLYYWSPQANGDTGNNEYKTSYTYEGTYHYATKKTYKMDQNTTIEEIYRPSSDEKNIEWAWIFANGVQKEQATRFLYDSSGRITEERRYKDGLMEYISIMYVYDSSILNGAYVTKKWTMDIRDADGLTAKYFESGKDSQSYKYDWYGNVTTVYNNGKMPTEYSYDRLGRMLRESVESGPFKSWSYISDPGENSVRISDENGCEVLYFAKANMRKLVYDGLGNLVQEQVYNENPGTGKAEYIPVKQYSYDQECRLDWEKDLVSGAVTDYTYYQDGRLQVKQINDTKNSNALLYKETYTYDDACNNGEFLKTTKTVLGEANTPSITSVAYTDKMGRLGKQGSLHNGAEYLDTFEYDYAGNKIKEKTARAYDEPGVYSNFDYTTRFDYDFAGRVIKTTNADGTFSTAEYDALGRLKRTADYKSNLTSPAAYWTSYEYDNLGRLIKEKMPFQNENGTIYYTIKKHYYDINGNMVTDMVTNNMPGQEPAYSRKDYEYDNRNRLTKVITHKNNDPERYNQYSIEATEYYTQYFYDFSGNKLRMFTGLSSPLNITNADNVSASGDSEYSTTKYEYDRFYHIAKMTDPNGNIESYSYDLNGNLLQKTDKNGSLLKMTYDVLGRLLAKSVENTENPAVNSSYSYTYTLTGNLNTMNGGGTGTAYYYDDLGRLVKEVLSNGVSKEYTYDAANNRKSLLVKQNGAVKTNTAYTYDNMNRLEKVFENEVLTATYAYDANGNRQSLTYSNGNKTTYRYNAANKLEAITNMKDGTILSSYTYSYYLDGNQASKTDNTGKITAYKYDGLGRLTNEAPTGEPAISYTYDDSSNRKTMTAAGKSVTTYAYDLSNRLQTETKDENSVSQTTKYTYDNNGNTICKSTETISPAVQGQTTGVDLSTPGAAKDDTDITINEYDGFNQLIKTSTGDITAEYTYDGNGLRTSKNINGTVTNHIWDGSQIILETSGTGEVTSKYVRGINLIYSEDGTGANRRFFPV